MSSETGAPRIWAATGQEPDSRQGGVGRERRRSCAGIGTGDPWLRAGRPDDVDATIGKNAVGISVGGAGPYARNPVAQLGTRGKFPIARAHFFSASITCSTIASALARISSSVAS